MLLLRGVEAGVEEVLPCLLLRYIDDRLGAPAGGDTGREVRSYRSRG